MIERVNWHVLRQAEGQRRRAAIVAARSGMPAPILVPDLSTAIDVSNRYAPEHLILQRETPSAGSRG